MAGRLVIYVENGEQAREMSGYLHSLGVEISTERGFYNYFDFSKEEGGPHSKLETLELTAEIFAKIIKNLPARIGGEVR